MRIPVRYPLSIFKFGATANGATGSADIGGEARSTAEGAVEEGGEEVLGLAQRLPLHRTQTLHSFHQSRKLLLEGKRR